MLRTQEVITRDGTVVRRALVVGDMHRDGQLWKRWSGRKWAHAAYSLHPHRLEISRPFGDEEAVTEASRKRALALAVEDQVARNAATVVLDGPSGAWCSPTAAMSHTLPTP